MLIKNKLFKSIFNTSDTPHLDEYDPIEQPYVGLGNPDANLLFVGSEKKEEVEFPIIYLQEFIYNYCHWSDLAHDNSYPGYYDALHPELKLRGHGPDYSKVRLTGPSLDHFNPFSPLTLDETCYTVYNQEDHIYKRIETIINGILLTFHSLPPKSIFNISPYKYDESIFSKCFLTELSDNPMSILNGKWDFDKFKTSPRGKQMKDGNLGNFYRSFNKVVIYAGKDYTGEVGSLQRAEIIRLFNPNLINNDIYSFHGHGDIRNHGQAKLWQKYVSPKGGAEVIVTEGHIMSAMFVDDSDTLGHFLGVMGIGDI
jgi:hypothetical protein